MPDKGQDGQNKSLRTQDSRGRINEFVLDKSIFSNVFDKDIRRIYIYRKCERLAKAIQLIMPAFQTNPSLKNRLDAVAIGLIDAAIQPSVDSRTSLARELLALSSLLSVARVANLISDMNADLITREAQQLLQETASYEAPRLSLEDVPTLSELAKMVPAERIIRSPYQPVGDIGHSIRQTVKDTPATSPAVPSETAANRRQAILDTLRTKGPSYIKDISMVVRDVSEKTIQRELQALVMQGVVRRTGDRRWTQYSLADSPVIN